MKLEELTLGMLTQAVESYLELAYRGGTQPRWVPDLALPADAAPAELLGLFQREDEDRDRPRYSMRLGNRNYPFMKLVLQEHIVVGSFQFSVDTHDEMEIKPDYPDYEAWMAVRRFNRELKRQIEQRFQAIGLPTSADVRRQVAERPRVAAESTGSTILVVDDEEDLADAVEALLAARGFRVEKANDGRKGLELAFETRPDLIVLDYELPEMDGLEVMAALRASVVTREIPVLLCTASKVGVEDIRKADGFLAKPYSEGLLYRMVDHLVDRHKRTTT